MENVEQQIRVYIQDIKFGRRFLDLPRCEVLALLWIISIINIRDWIQYRPLV
jgi:hypothetical protein